MASGNQRAPLLRSLRSATPRRSSSAAPRTTTAPLSAKTTPLSFPSSRGFLSPAIRRSCYSIFVCLGGSPLSFASPLYFSSTRPYLHRLAFVSGRPSRSAIAPSTHHNSFLRTCPCLAQSSLVEVRVATGADPVRTKLTLLSSGGTDGGVPSLRQRGSTSTAAMSCPSPPIEVTRWSDLPIPYEPIRDRVVPPLSHTSHKGSSGRIGVLGGSERYTGAPYYAAMAALHVGADLAFVFCAEEAAVPIKCYSPELMVAGVYSAKEFRKAMEMDEGEEGEKERTRLVERMVSEVTDLFPAMHALVVGPGLGRHPLVMRAAATVIRRAREVHLPLVLDADALFLLSQTEYRDLLAGGCNGEVVLTPNVMEYKRLVKGMGESSGNDEGGFGDALQGAVVVRKGFNDSVSLIASSSDVGMTCEEEGGLKRSGGLGDVLSGTLGTFVAWHRILGERGEGNGTKSDSKGKHDDDNALLLLSCWSACCVVKRATAEAFRRKRRAMTAPDVLEDIGPVVDMMTSPHLVEQQDVDGSAVVGDPRGKL